MKNIVGILFLGYMLFVIVLWLKALMNAGSGKKAFHDSAAIFFGYGGLGVLAFYVIGYAAGWIK